MVDRAARDIIRSQGLEQYFTHRLGHGTNAVCHGVMTGLIFPIGIGLEVHESPYLRGGTDDIILTGHTFSDEPGVYIEGKVSTIEARVV